VLNSVKISAYLTIDGKERYMICPVTLQNSSKCRRDIDAMPADDLKSWLYFTHIYVKKIEGNSHPTCYTPKFLACQVQVCHTKHAHARPAQEGGITTGW
jgi:hypothetical protein